MHNTAIGGCVSIIMKGLYFTYLVYLINKMYNFNDDRFYQYEHSEENDYSGTGLKYADMGIDLHHILYYYDEDGERRPLYYNDTVK